MRLIAPLLGTVLLATGPFPARAQTSPHNVVLFVADGLRQGMVSPQTAPTISALMQRGVRFTNTHSMFPTFTTANASALATGHKLGDTGDFSNVIDSGFEVPGASGSRTPFLENDIVLGDVDAHFAGDYMNQETVMRAARQAGLGTAAIGKLGPTLIFDHTERSGAGTIIIDDTTGRPGGIPLSADLSDRLRQAGLPLQSPTRGENGKAGDARTPGTLQPNATQQDFFLAATTRAVLPLLKERGTAFMLVFWSRDPDGTQHNQGDSLGRLVPGINGPTSLAAIRNADHDLAELLAALETLGLARTTDVIVTADHGFSTISKESATSVAATRNYADVPAHLLPPGFLAIDLAHGLDLPLLDPDAGYAAVAEGSHPSRGNGLIGGDRHAPKLVVAANGGSDLVYLPDGDADLARRAVAVLAAQDYVSGLFVSDVLGPIPGTLPLSAIDLKGSAVTPMPAIVVSFRSFSTGCAQPTTCGAEVADSGLQQGQGMHGSFSRADTAIPGVAVGPDFQSGQIDDMPTSNADIGKTIARILGLSQQDTGSLVGRVLGEAMPGGAVQPVERERIASPPDEAGRRTELLMLRVGQTRYFNAAGYAGRTLGLDPQATTSP